MASLFSSKILQFLEIFPLLLPSSLFFFFFFLNTSWLKSGSDFCRFLFFASSLFFLLFSHFRPFFYSSSSPLPLSLSLFSFSRLVLILFLRCFYAYICCLQLFFVLRFLMQVYLLHVADDFTWVSQVSSSLQLESLLSFLGCFMPISVDYSFLYFSWLDFTWKRRLSLFLKTWKKLCVSSTFTRRFSLDKEKTDSPDTFVFFQKRERERKKLSEMKEKRKEAEIIVSVQETCRDSF